jgi:proteic killer suppression protein
MIESFRHKGLERYFLKGETKGIPTQSEQKIRRILFAINTAKTPSDIGQPSFKLHPLKGDMKDFWSVWVTANRRIIFRFKDGNAYDVELIDYH